MKRIGKILSKSYVSVIISALLSALPYSFSSLFFLSWFSFVPFFIALMRCRDRFRNKAGLGFLFGFFYHFFTYWWFIVLYPMEFAGVSKTTAAIIVAMGWVGISLLHGCLFVLPGLAVQLGRKLSSRSFCGAAFLVAFLAAEWITELGPLAFPWVRVSLGHFRAPVLLQSASLVGVYGTDLIILSVNVLIAYALLGRARRRIVAGSMAALVFVANLAFGLTRIKGPADPKDGISVMAVQGNILSGEKWAADGTARSLDTYLSLTEESCSGVDIAVWPESAVPVFLNRKSGMEYLNAIKSLSENKDVSILVGGFWLEDEQEGNAAVLVCGDKVSEPYLKRHLVPFGEAVPYRAFFETCFPFMTEINMLSEDLVAGTDPAVFQTEGGNIGCLICFESVFPSLARDSAKDGAGAFAVITNDSWYEDSPAVYQHLAHAVLRSIENGRGTVRAANSGVSAVIDPKGVILEELGPLQKGCVVSGLALSDQETFYTAHGDLVLPVFAGLTFAWGLLLLLKNRRRHGTQR